MSPIGIGVPFLFRTIAESEAAGLVTENLLIHIDASNASSYPGSGTTWTDLEGNYNTTLVNGPTYSSDDGGAIVFDGTDDYGILGKGISELSNVQAYTFQAWYNFADVASIQLPWAYQRGGLNKMMGSQYHHGTNRLSIYASLTNANQNGYIDNVNLVADTWYNITWVFNGTGGTNAERAQMYMNGVNQTLGFGAGGISTHTPTFQHYHEMYLGARHTGVGQRFNGKIGEVEIYTSSLTAEEVQQNYNATKGRYGH